MNAELNPRENECEIVEFPKVAEEENITKIPKLTKAGEIKKTPCNSIKGKAHEVYPLKKKEDIEAIKQYYRDKIDSLTNDEDKQIAARDLLIFIFGINCGLRMSDILKLKWSDLLNRNKTYKDAVRIIEKKTDKFKNFYLNTSCKNAFDNYTDRFNIERDLDSYIFFSREKNFIDVNTFSISLKKAAIQCGIQFNVATHTCRKTWAYNQIMAHQNDAYFMAHLMRLLNHSSISATLRYAGLEDEKNKQYYNDINL